MSIKDQIRKELERMKIDYLNRSYTFVPAAMQQLLEFLDSLPEQPVDGLEEEVKKYWNAHNLDYRIGRVADLDFIFLCARHFAEWGAKHLKK